jgi:hypothetical protein
MDLLTADAAAFGKALAAHAEFFAPSPEPCPDTQVNKVEISFAVIGSMRHGKRSTSAARCCQKDR